MKLLPMVDRLAEIRRLYFATTRATIDRDFDKALELLKAMDSEDERSRATVFMHGLAQMRSDWSRGPQAKGRGGKKRDAARQARSGAGSKPKA
jgi:hypothetical protein